MVCKRGHGAYFQIKLVGRKTKFCDYILAYRQREGKIHDSVLYCGDLRKGSKIPKGYIELGGLKC